MPQHPEVLIVGAGPAGIACAIKLARSGVRVLVLEGAEFAGAENWSGAVYHADSWLRDDLIGPELWRDAPRERRVVARQLFLHDGQSAGGFEARAVPGNDFGEAWTVLRPKLDRWLAARAVDFGATLLTRTTVTGLRYDGERVVGVNTNRGPIEADCVFLAEGDAAGLVAREGLERHAQPEYAQGIMAVFALAAEEIERRFELRRDEGVAQEWLIRNGTLGGKPVRLNATAFLYTNRDSLSVGLVLPLDKLAANGVADHPHLLKRVLALPGIAPYLEGARQVAYGAKVIRAGGVAETPVWVRDGLAVGGSAIGLGQEIPYPNFIAPAITTGVTFAEAWLRLRAHGTAPTRAALEAEYGNGLRATDDYRNAELTKHWPHAIHGGPLLFDTLPALIGQLANAETLPPDEARAQRQRAFAAAMKDLRAVMRQARGFMRGLYARGARSHPRNSHSKVPPLAVRWLLAGNGARPREIEMPDYALLQLLAHAVGHFYGRRLPRYADRLANVWRAPGRVAAAMLSAGMLATRSAHGAVRLVSDLAAYRWKKLPLAELMSRPWHRHERASRLALDWQAAKRKAESPVGWIAPLARFAPDTRHISVPLEGGADRAWQLRNVCPAEVYSIVSSQGGVASQFENCIKCESCRVTVPDVDWNRTTSHRLAYRVPHDGRYGFDAAVQSALALPPPRAAEPAGASLRDLYDWLRARPAMVDAEWIAALDALLARLPADDMGSRLARFRERGAWGWMESELRARLADAEGSRGERAAWTVTEHARQKRRHRYAQLLARFDRDGLRAIAREGWSDADRAAWFAFVEAARPHAAEAVEWVAEKSGALAWLAVNHFLAEDYARRAIGDAFAAPLWREPDGQSNWLPAMAAVLVTPLGNQHGTGDITANGLALDGAQPVRRACDAAVPGFEAHGRLAELRLAMALGELTALRARAIEYAGSRVQFRGDIKDREGREAIAKFGAVKNMLATIEHARAMLEAARADCASAPRAVLERVRTHMGPWMDAVPWVAGQIFGGMAFSEEEIFAPRYRDATLLAQWPGTRGPEDLSRDAMDQSLADRPEARVARQGWRVSDFTEQPGHLALAGFDKWRNDSNTLRAAQIPLVARRRVRGRALHWNAKEKFTYRSGSFISGRLLPAANLLTIEHYRRDPVLRKTRADMLRLLRGGFRSPRRGEPYGRYIDRLHGMPDEDAKRLRDFNAFASIVPEALGGRGWNKAQYSILTNELMSRGDVSTGLLVMASTSIGTMPVALGLDKDLPRLRRELDACLGDTAAWNGLRARLDALIAMLAHPDPKRFRAAMEGLGADVRAMFMQPGSTLKYLARGFLLHVQAAAGIAKARDLDALEPALRALRAELDAVHARFIEEREALDARRAAHARFLQFLGTGQISAFALTEPGAGSDTGAIQTRAISREVELIALSDGRYEFTPHGGGEARILADAARLEFTGVSRREFAGRRAARYRLDNGDYAELDDSDWDMSANRGVRHLKTGDRRLPFHDLGIPVARDGKLLYRYFELSGNKMWITNGSVADRYAFYAQGEEGECAVMLERRSEGLRIGPNENKLGQRASPTNELTLDRVRVDASQLIGFAGHGQVNALETLSVGRGGLVMSCAILVGRLIDDFPREWAKNPALAARAQAERDSLETLAARLVGLMDPADLDRGYFRIEAAFSKYIASEGAHRVLGWLETLMGPAAAAIEQPLEKWRRDIRILNIYEGTNEVQRFLVLKDLPGLLKEPSQPVTDNPALDAALSVFREFAAPRVQAAGKELLADPDLQTRFFPIVEWAGDLYTWCALHERVRALEAAGESANATSLSRGPREGVPDVPPMTPPIGESADRDTIARLLALQSSLASRLDDRARQLREAFRAADQAGVHPADHGIALARRALAPPPAPDEAPLRVGPIAGAITCVLRANMTRRDDGLEFAGWHGPDIAALDRVLDWRDGSPDLTVSVVALAPPGVEDRLRALQALGVTVHYLACETPSAHAAAQWLRANDRAPGWIVIGTAAADARDADFGVELASALDTDLVTDVMAIGPARRGLWLENANFERHYCHARRPLVFALDVRPSGRSDEFPARAWLDALHAPLPAAIPLTVPRTLAVHAAPSAPVSDLPERFESPAKLADWLRARFGAAGAVESPAAVVRGDAAMSAAPVWVAAPDELARVRGSAALRLAHDCGPDFAVLTWTARGANADRFSRELNIAGLRGVWRAERIGGTTGAAQLAPVLRPLLQQTRAIVVSPAQRELGAALAGQLGMDLFEGVLDVSDTHVTCARGDYVAEYPRNGPAVYAADPAYRAHALPEGAPEIAVAAIASNDAGDVRPSSLWRFLTRAAKPAGLASAPIVVDTGLGVGDATRFQAWVTPLAARLAELSGRPVEIGATRRVTQELKLVGADRQIGQTGVAVAPELLFALGISGAPQHMQWIGKDTIVIAINHDPTAPIFTWHRQNPGPRVIACVGALEEWIPALLDCLKY
jgi:electron transfer flavoprotein-quinone oxidoreductase